MVRTALTGADPHLINPIAQAEHIAQPTDADTTNSEHRAAPTDPTIQPVDTIVHPRPCA